MIHCFCKQMLKAEGGPMMSVILLVVFYIAIDLAQKITSAA